MTFNKRVIFTYGISLFRYIMTISTKTIRIMLKKVTVTERKTMKLTPKKMRQLKMLPVNLKRLLQVWKINFCFIFAPEIGKTKLGGSGIVSGVRNRWKIDRNLHCKCTLIDSVEYRFQICILSFLTNSLPGFTFQCYTPLSVPIFFDILINFERRSKRKMFCYRVENSSLKDQN